MSIKAASSVPPDKPPIPVDVEKTGTLQGKRDYKVTVINFCIGAIYKIVQFVKAIFGYESEEVGLQTLQDVSNFYLQLSKEDFSKNHKVIGHENKNLSIEEKNSWSRFKWDGKDNQMIRAAQVMTGSVRQHVSLVKENPNIKLPIVRRNFEVMKKQMLAEASTDQAKTKIEALMNKAIAKLPQSPKSEEILSSLSKLLTFLENNNFIEKSAPSTPESAEQGIINAVEKLATLKIDDSNIYKINLLGFKGNLEHIRGLIKDGVSKEAFERIMPVLNKIIKEADVLNKQKIQNSLSKLLKLLDAKMELSADHLMADVSFSHSEIGVFGDIEAEGFQDASSGTLTFPKNMKMIINYEDGSVILSGKGITATSKWPGMFYLHEIKVENNGSFTFSVAYEVARPIIGGWITKLAEQTFTEKQLEATFSKLTWNPLAPGESDTTSKELPVEEAVEVVQPVAIMETPTTPSLLNRVTTFAGENSQAIIGTVSTVAILGAHFLGFI